MITTGIYTFFRSLLDTLCFAVSRIRCINECKCEFHYRNIGFDIHCLSDDFVVCLLRQLYGGGDAMVGFAKDNDCR